ncbi:hypothetical protein NA78x_004368 [Anatilimnocola sp. NA78]|uniref:YXWGXW repeat-containing protein n=1 Tax=Anatilimnocola sp. NA78 TaxID=3415683 RepID=UPI003CE477F6
MKRVLVSLAAIGCASWLTYSAQAQEELPREPVPVVADQQGDDNFEQLTRGPVHEAFAQAVTPPVEEGLVISKAPPALIEEIPPEQRPAGDNIAWIPGYWGWDDERKDFLWISGIWRAMPPGREWVPGYWAEVTQGFQWMPGYWADMKVAETEYLPAPPETVDAGPNTQAPTGEEIWIPGVWSWQQDRYVWRAGYWSRGSQNWIWTNAHYVYTPRGYVYVSGYWDYNLPRRGILYAPAYFRGPIAQGYRYSPSVVINTAQFIDHLFLRPTYRHYYFGDYYAANYRGRGILPWFAFHNSRYGFDPIYSYNRWNNRNDRDWERRVEARYEDLRDREDGRPPRTYADWQKRNGGNNRDSFVFGSVQDLTNVRDNNWKFNKLSEDARRDVGRLSQDLDTYRQQRIKTESDKTARRDNDGRGSDRVRLLKPPIGDENAQPVRDRDNADRPGRDNDRPGIDRPGRDEVLPGRDTPRGEDRPVRPGVDRPGRDEVLPPRDTPRSEDRPGRPGEDRPGRGSVLPGDPRGGDRPGRSDDNTPPKLDRPVTPRPLDEPKAPSERGVDPRTLPQEAPRSARDLPGPLNDVRTPGRDMDRPKSAQDRPGPLNDTRDTPRDRPKTGPGLDRNPPKAETPKAAPRVERDAPKAEAPRAPRVNPAPPREAPRAAPAPRPMPSPAAPAPNRGGGNEGKGKGGGGKKGD